MNTWQLVLYGAVGFLSTILSGIAGAGAAFIMTPLAIFLGLTPAQAVATGKFNGLAVTVGSLSGMWKVRGKVSKRRVIPVMVLAFVIGLFVPHVITSLDGEVYRIILGVMLLLMVPVLLLKKVGINPTQPKRWQRWLGGSLLAGALFLQGAFSAGLGMLVNLVLMSFLGMTALEANLTKRWSALILNITIIFGVIGSGLVVWHVAAVSVVCVFLGSYIGGRLAVKKGDTFIMRIMAVMMVVSALVLLFGA